MNKKRKTPNAFKIALAIIFILALSLRLYGLNTIIFMEETTWAWLSGGNFEKLGLDYPTAWGDSIWPHPPAAPLLYKVSANLFGLQTMALRLVPLIFGMLSIFMVYKICKKYYNIKTALLATGLMALSYWHILASLQIDVDGGILTFLFLLFIYSFLEFDISKSKKWLAFTGVVFGLSLLVKYSSVLIFIVAILFCLTKKKFDFENVKNLSLIFIIGVALFSIFPLLSLSNPETFSATTSHASGYGSIHPSIRPIIYLLVFGTPLYIGLTIISMKNINKKNVIFLLWIFFILIMYTLFLGPYNAEGPFARYLMVIIPPLCILGGDFLSRIKFDKKDIYLLSILFVISFLSIFLINIMNARYLDHNIQKYIEEAANLRWDYNFPIMANSEPGFWINFNSLAAVSIISITIIVILLLLKNTNTRPFKILLIIFIAITLAFNIFFVQEFLFHTTHPDITKVTYEMVDYYEQKGFTGPICTNALSFSFYLDKKNTGKTELYLLFGNETNDELQLKPAIENNATLMITEYYPTIAKNSRTWELINQCELLKKFDDKNVTMGYIFSC